MSADGEFCYVGIKKCGCMASAIVDCERTRSKEIARFMRDTLKEGLTIERAPIERVRKELIPCPHDKKAEKGSQEGPLFAGAGGEA